MSREIGQIIIAGIPVMIFTGLRLGMAYLRFKRKAKKAAAVFEHQLILGGMTRNEAKELTGMYLESSRIVHMGMKGVFPGRARG